MTSDPGTSAAATLGGTYVGNWSLPLPEGFELPLVLEGATGVHASSPPRPPAATINQPARRSIARRDIPPRSLMRRYYLVALQFRVRRVWHGRRHVFARTTQWHTGPRSGSRQAARL